MLAKYLAAAVAGSLLVASAAFAAETSTTPGTSTTANASDSSYKGDWRASKMVGLNVYNDKNENIGSINELLMDKSGSIKAAVISVGGFLGMGARLVAVPYDKVKFTSEPVAPPTTASNTGGGATSPGGMAKPPSTTTTGSTSNAPAAAPPKPNPWYPDHAVFNAAKDELKNMPEFKYSTE
ncbi:MAG TPA: PRC-barrel domain-containing protein [Bradyrhizobium sp.]|uniref:PRC-barrel domain-containing protein n=1 Tax=Bradyrhizobium sp. TaxID=376 RepID=UPI002BE7AA45|nr:PRC-barrel domain-containing protein [Bradyrhizobium sp.]HLZ02577.1 PRC-barrel domain-containing protein [Bradyrhizobium sp.]